MKVPEGRIEGVVSTEVVRYSLTEVHLDVEKARLMASDGKIGVILPVELEEGDTSGPIHPKRFKEARARARKLKVPATMKVNGNVTYAGGATEGRSEVMDSGMKFPNLDAVVPGPKGRMVCLNADLLKALADALQDPKGRDPGAIKLFIPEKKGDAIRVEPWGKADTGKVGVIMPLVDK